MMGYAASLGRQPINWQMPLCVHLFENWWFCILANKSPVGLLEWGKKYENHMEAQSFLQYFFIICSLIFNLVNNLYWQIFLALFCLCWRHPFRLIYPQPGTSSSCGLGPDTLNETLSTDLDTQEWGTLLILQLFHLYLCCYFRLLPCCITTF